MAVNLVTWKAIALTMTAAFGLSAPIAVDTMQEGAGGDGADNGGMPANKAAAAGDIAEVFSPQEDKEILNLTLKATKVEDLVFMVTLECVITTELTTVGNDLSQAIGRVRIWVEDNGVEVPVS